VVRTGADSGLGRIATLVADAGLRPTLLQLRLSRLSRQLVLAVGLICLVVLLLAVLQGESWTRAAVLAVSLGVAAVPESLPAVVTLSLALRAHRMAGRSAVVRRLPAVETLGSVTVLASDKTGTLTQGVLTVRRVWTPSGGCAVTGMPYGVAGGLEGGASARAAATLLLTDAALCNDASLTRGTDDEWSAVGDPFDVALLVAAAKAGVMPGSLTDWERIDETPYASELGYARTVNVGPDGQQVEVVKGAPETVLALLPPGPVATEARAEAERLAAEGHRVLAVLTDGHRLGLVAVLDPAHPAAAEVVAQCRAAGIRIVLVTGDHPATARAVAAELGILHSEGTVVSGDAFARCEQLGHVEDIDVYARTKPEQKLGIIDAWQANGDVVAMTGDGVNDAPALRRADIGVAMGGRGTEVARQAADLVLVDDDLRTLVVAVGEGRRIHANIRTFLRYGLAGGLAEVVVLLLAPLCGLPIPLTPAMILWINMVTHGLPGVAFGGEPLDPALMSRPTPPPRRSVLDRTLLRQIVAAGALVAATSLLAGWWAVREGGSVQTAVFLTLGLGQLAVALALRAPPHGLGLAAAGSRSGRAGRGGGPAGGDVAAGLARAPRHRTPGCGHHCRTSRARAVPGLVVGLVRRRRRDEPKRR
jgi:Ca2+-transporting ATPase